MRLSVSLFLVVALLGAAITVPASAAMPTGTYQMQWQVPTNTSGATTFCNKYGTLKPITPELAARVQGLASTKAYACELGGATARTLATTSAAAKLEPETEAYTLILDESKGTDTGYDTAYVIRNAPKRGTIDLGKAVKVALTRTATTTTARTAVSLRVPTLTTTTATTTTSATTTRTPVRLLTSRNYTYLQTASGQPLPTMDVPVGPVGTQQMKKAAVSVRVTLQGVDEKAPKLPSAATLTLLGGWAATVKTSDGEVVIKAQNSNSNSTFSDLSTEANRYGDSITVDFGKRVGAAASGLTRVYIGKACQYDGKFYEANVTPVGDKVTIRPYSGGTGTLKIKALDGMNANPESFTVTASGTMGSFSFSSANGTDFVVPAGDYTVSTVIYPKQTATGTSRVYIRCASKSPVKVASGQTVRLWAGGEVGMQIEPATDVVKATTGKDLKVALAFTAGSDKVSGVGGGRKAAVSIADETGKVVLSGEAGFG